VAGSSPPATRWRIDSRQEEIPDQSISAVYTTLERLERKGLLRSRIGALTPERGGRRRRLFELLPLGARSLRDAFRALTGMRSASAPACTKSPPAAPLLPGRRSSSASSLHSDLHDLNATFRRPPL
jgi:DNA-binding PadR family transcriptional regulator